jgi:cytochrome c biogenesis protein CcmG/thiol:disulfide interchange protein DsbE
VSVETDIDTDLVSSTGPLPVASPRVSGRHTARWVGIIVLVIASGLVAVLATRPSAQTAEAQSPLLGRVAPPITGVTLSGANFSLPRAPGHYVVVNFFASWCIPCQEEGPELVAFQFRHQQRGDASVVSVTFQDTPRVARLYQQRLGATWPTMVDPNQAIALSYGVREDPTSFVIAPGGRVVASILGGVTVAGLDRIIARAEAKGYGL